MNTHLAMGILFPLPIMSFIIIGDSEIVNNADKIPREREREGKQVFWRCQCDRLLAAIIQDSRWEIRAIITSYISLIRPIIAVHDNCSRCRNDLYIFITAINFARVPFVVTRAIGPSSRSFSFLKDKSPATRRLTRYTFLLETHKTDNAPTEARSNEYAAMSSERMHDAEFGFVATRKRSQASPKSLWIFPAVGEEEEEEEEEGSDDPAIEPVLRALVSQRKLPRKIAAARMQIPYECRRLMHARSSSHARGKHGGRCSSGDYVIFNFSVRAAPRLIARSSDSAVTD